MIDTTGRYEYQGEELNEDEAIGFGTTRITSPGNQAAPAIFLVRGKVIEVLPSQWDCNDGSLILPAAAEVDAATVDADWIREHIYAAHADRVSRIFRIGDCDGCGAGGVSMHPEEGVCVRCVRGWYD